MSSENFSPPCRECGGSCCGYIAVEVDAPKTKAAVDHMRWYLLHKNVNVFEEDNTTWYVEFKTPCEQQGRNKRCKYYEQRPRICQDYGNEEGLCEYYAPPYTKYFSTVESFEEYLESIGFDWRYKR